MSAFKRYGLLLLLACLLIFFPHLGILPVNIMEARNFVTAREMVTEGNWLLTTLNGLPRYEKPPLPTWLTALSGMLFGWENVALLRLPAALMACGMVGFFYRLVLKIQKNDSFAMTAGLVLLTSFYVIVSGRDGQWDIFTHGFMMVGIYFFYRFWEEERRLWKNALLAAAFIGFSFLSKGPVSLYALFLPFLLSYSWVYRFKKIKSRLLPLTVLCALVLMIGLWWYVYVRWADPTSFLQVAREETTNWVGYNTRPFYYYWSFVVQSGVWTLPACMGLLYPYLIKRVHDKKAYRFSFFWTVFSVVLLSVIPEKKSRYLLPVLLPLAVNTAFYLQYLFYRFTDVSKKERFPVYLHFGLVAFIGLAFPIAGYWSLGKKLDGLWGYFITTSFVLVVLAIFLVIELKKKNIQMAFWLNIAFVMGIITQGFPISKAFKTNPSFHDLTSVRTFVEKNRLKLYSFAEIAPEMVWHYGKSIPPIKQKSDAYMPPERAFGILIVPTEEAEFRRVFEPNYTIQFKESVDSNYQKTRKNRLLGNFYVVTKK